MTPEDRHFTSRDYSEMTVPANLGNAEKRPQCKCERVQIHTTDCLRGRNALFFFFGGINVLILDYLFYSWDSELLLLNKWIQRLWLGNFLSRVLQAWEVGKVYLSLQSVFNLGSLVYSVILILVLYSDFDLHLLLTGWFVSRSMLTKTLLATVATLSFLRENSVNIWWGQAQGLAAPATLHYQQAVHP